MTGVHVAAVSELPVDEQAEPTRAERIEALRRRIAAVPARGEVSRPAPAPDAAQGPPERLLPLPRPLAELLPHGGLVRGTVVSVSGATSLLLGMLASVTAGGGHAAVIGHRRLGLLAAAEMGARLCRLAVIPDPGPDPVAIAAVLLDGMDLVVLGLGGASVPPSRARAVAARARSKGAVLVVTDGRWDGVQVRLEAQVNGYDGLAGPGRGRLCGTRLSVRAHGRACPPRTTRADVCATRGEVTWASDRRVRPEIVSEPDRVTL
ncbi:hypothetical protein [Rhodococcus chondri]|uniref:Uncharacterized protein n=1 Tax=Rhodococcus chondri TaxID=3065941 RepID=A0ABU7JWI8_9NOCA|nr:hypothetical protein [Rhodococcus sp. CC-R104]MEE2034388.1 hypothetical protein [Rhodococcus sp. CC-R104]